MVFKPHIGSGVLAIILSGGLLLSCGPSPEELAATAAVLTATATSTRTPTNSPTPTPTNTATPTPTPTPTPAVLVGAGDISRCSNDRDEMTAQLLDEIAGTVFTLGDNAYPNGTHTEFSECYGPTWGRHKDRTRPSPGNHDYRDFGAGGYYTYFDGTASPLEPNCTSDCKGYYSYDLGTWHIIALNSEIDRSAGSAQEQWLRADLAAHQNTCTLAYWHNPRFSSGRHGNSRGAHAFWQALYDHGADVVLNGHDHTYERFAPQSPTGQFEPTRGIREFVVGTGGVGLYDFSTIEPNSEVRNNTTWGVLKLTLHPTSYDWEFIPIDGQTFTDSGSAACVSDSPPNQPPVAVNDSASTAEDTAVTIDVAANDSDPQGSLDLASANTTCTTCATTSNGSLANNGNGTFAYTPSRDFNGSDSFVYEICDTLSACDTATVTITVNPYAPVTVEVRVAAGSDDAEEKASGSVRLTSSDLELVFDGSDQTVGMRFNGIAIPPGASITSAYVQFQVDETAPTGPTTLSIQGQEVDNAVTFTSSSGNISSRPRTTAAVSWSPVPWTTVGEAGPAQQTPDIASVVQEILNRPGWASGNSLVIIITGTGERVSESYNGDQSGAPLLHVEYVIGMANQASTEAISASANFSMFTASERITFAGNTSDAARGTWRKLV